MIVPDHLYKDTCYDKWGNVVLSDGRRTMGELSSDESVQKILREGNVVVTPYVKYPRTYHLPWSNPSRDDRVLDTLKAFEGAEIIVTEKMDGENTTLYNDYYHTRAVDGEHHPWQGRTRAYHASFAHDIPRGYRVCGENLVATKSIKYDRLNHFFLGFSVWNNLTCLSWDDTLEWFKLLGIEPVPVLYKGPWNVHLLSSIMLGSIDWTQHEGYVVRVAGSFELKDFRTHVGKYVRRDFYSQHDWSWKENNVVFAP